MIFAIVKRVFNDRMPSSLHVLTWKDVKDINVKCKRRNIISNEPNEGCMRFVLCI